MYEYTSRVALAMVALLATTRPVPETKRVTEGMVETPDGRLHLSIGGKWVHRDIVVNSKVTADEPDVGTVLTVAWSIQPQDIDRYIHGFVELQRESGLYRQYQVVDLQKLDKGDVSIRSFVADLEFEASRSKVRVLCVFFRRNGIVVRVQITSDAAIGDRAEVEKAVCRGVMFDGKKWVGE